MKDHIRQGDVLLVYIDEIPANATLVATDDAGRAVLAYGEVSGHAHLVEARETGTVQYYRTPAGERFLALLAKTMVTHGTLTDQGIAAGTADHTALLLRKGRLQQAFQVEDYGVEVRRVAD